MDTFRTIKMFFFHPASVWIIGDSCIKRQPHRSNEGGSASPPPAVYRHEDHPVWHHPEMQVEGWCQSRED